MVYYSSVAMCSRWLTDLNQLQGFVVRTNQKAFYKSPTSSYGITPRSTDKRFTHNGLMKLYSSMATAEPSQAVHMKKPWINLCLDYRGCGSAQLSREQQSTPLWTHPQWPELHNAEGWVGVGGGGRIRTEEELCPVQGQEAMMVKEGIKQK